MGRRAYATIATLCLLPAAEALGAGNDLKAELRSTTVLVQARGLVEAGRHAEAVALLEPAAREDPGNADVHNGLGHALREAGRLDEAGAAYARALALDPAHRGAREYLGELHLARGDLGRAREELAALDRLCPGGCEEREELAQAIRAREGG